MGHWVHCPRARGWGTVSGKGPNPVRRRAVESMTGLDSRRRFLQKAGAAALGTLPLGLMKRASGDALPSFTFVFVSDAHIQHVGGARFVRSWDRGLVRAVAEINRLRPKPDFVVFGGDLAHMGTRQELDHGAELLSRLETPVHMVMGEHDYYLDLGEQWSTLFGDHHYSFDHKGVHFVVLNSVLTFDRWTHQGWATPEERMLRMAGPDVREGSPFMVGALQREWLRQDLETVRRTTPVVVLSHSPLQKIHPHWNFWTDDADEVRALLAPFDEVTVLYGHVHQMQHNRIGNVTFHGALATAWPWPYPPVKESRPLLKPPRRAADPFFERDATGWQLVDVGSGRVRVDRSLYNMRNSRGGEAT